MSWVTIVWSLLIGACLTMAAPHVLIWIWQRRTERLVFVILIAAMIADLSNELILMRSSSLEQFAGTLRWRQVPLFVQWVTLVVFVRLYFGTGRWWLGLSACGLRLACLVINFALPPNLYFQQMSALRPEHLFGETVSMAVGVPSPWSHLTEISSILLIAFVVDASISKWRKGQLRTRRRALVIGGSIVIYEVLAAAIGMLVHATNAPGFVYVVSLPFVVVLAAMAFELSYDLFAARSIEQKLESSEASLREEHERMDLATAAAEVGIWVWDVARNEIWISEKGRMLFGLAPSEKLDIERFRNAVHPDDRDSMRRAVESSLSTGREYEAEHRVLLPDGQVRWLAARGRVEFDRDRKAVRIRGVSADVTKRKVAEEELRESEARFRTVADSAPVFIWMSGPDKLCTFFNKPWLEFTGRTMEQEMGNGWAEGVHPDDLQRCHQTYTAAFDAREPFVMKYRLRRHDGEYRWIKDDGVPRYDTQKNFTGYIGSCVDITESRGKEQALRESEERMSLAMDAAKLGLWEWNVNTDELWGSKARRTLLGLPSSGIKLEQGLARVHVDDRDRVRRTLKDAARSGQDYHLEYRIVLPDGTIQWTDHRGRCVRGADGKDLILRGISMDISERKRAEEKFRMAVEASPSGILLVNQTGQIVLVNSQIEQLFGYGREELIGHSVEILVPERFAGAHPEHRAKFFAAPATRAMGAGRELFARRKDGSEFPVEIGLNPIQSPEGMLILAAVVDISERKTAEEEARRRREQIDLLSRVSLLGEMTASIAHELNQPLSAIVSNASAGQRFIDQGKAELETLREILVDVAADGRRAHEVLQNIRNTIKKGAAVRQQMDLNQVVESVTHLVQPNAAVHFCEIQTSLQSDLPKIEGDPVQIQQVLINLVSNAFEAMREVPVVRRNVKISTEKNGDDTICISVRDHGRGVSPEARQHLFEQFFTTKEEGLGMGLAIVRSIIEAHGGRISVENMEDGGARFYFTLPTPKPISK